jgi:predicted O-methyltransferase YrrM
MEPTAIKTQTDRLLELSKSLSGHLRKREVQFLATLPFLSLEGDILEIGSFKGKSTIILAKAAKAAGHGKIHACDPLSLSCSTDPTDAIKEELPRIFYNNLQAHGVQDQVEFFQMRSQELAEIWNKPLKILWIDGDHTYDGVMKDITFFEKHLEPGAIVCFHDVLHEFEGPIRVFMEKVLLSGQYGDCGLCGSIGWGQFLGGRPLTGRQWESKLLQYHKLSRLMVMVLKTKNGFKVNKHLRRFFRSLVPHGPILPDDWINKRNSALEP